jgi:hypothetical protein
MKSNGTMAYSVKVLKSAILKCHLTRIFLWAAQSKAKMENFLSELYNGAAKLD